MRFMTIVKSAESWGPPSKELIDAIGELAQEATGAGIMLETGGLAPTAMGTSVRLRRGELTVVDGPFTETKEVVGGYAIFELKSKAEAIEWTRRFMELHKEHWPGWEGETEIRQMCRPEDFKPGE